jgi:hypothetical protein
MGDDFFLVKINSKTYIRVMPKDLLFTAIVLLLSLDLLCNSGYDIVFISDIDDSTA